MMRYGFICYITEVKKKHTIICKQKHMIAHMHPHNEIIYSKRIFFHYTDTQFSLVMFTYIWSHHIYI